MSNWKYTDATNEVVVRTNADGSSESCLVSAIAEWLSEGNTPEAADPISELVPAPTLVEQIMASPDDLAALKAALGL